MLGNHDYGDGASEAEDEACLAADGGCPRSPLYQVHCFVFVLSGRCLVCVVWTVFCMCDFSHLRTYLNNTA